MSTHTPQPTDIEIVGRSSSGADDDLWGPVPRDQRLDWLLVASRHWPIFPGVFVGVHTDKALSEGQLVRSESLIRIARNAFEAGFSPDEYAILRRIIRGGVPEHLVARSDPRSQHAERYFEIDAHQWRDWLDDTRAGVSPARATEAFFATH